MSSCTEAKYHRNICGEGRLDRDKDGIPCKKPC
ncbi:Excalibur calcium-binding domain [Aggregatibacter aphrophilus]|uniref:Excalibur calcium-binding domain n=3 Tax=Aggregatibacter aphrophilus TaxID=732 RepID=A0A336N237_AGGAP|nr:excalibur calcium-binding domain-containing protein [Aggregatibacter aphrophilus]SSY93433.1 Excalibur calcium-binding domain [Aggregatibacter aphrophilus]VEF44524.1 Excalibur calcium-binding domain [Aggregatibacter aphrophilus ATCC 33389]